MKRLITLVILLLCFNIQAQDITPKCTASVYSAKDFIGKEITVCGYVAQINTIETVNGKPTYINMGGQFPNHSFTLVIWHKNILNWEGASLQDYNNQLVAVTGEVKLYKGSPQIEVYVPKQIEIIKL